MDKITIIEDDNNLIWVLFKELKKKTKPDDYLDWKPYVNKEISHELIMFDMEANCILRKHL